MYANDWIGNYKLITLVKVNCKHHAIWTHDIVDRLNWFVSSCEISIERICFSFVAVLMLNGVAHGCRPNISVEATSSPPWRVAQPRTTRGGAPQVAD